MSPGQRALDRAALGEPPEIEQARRPIGLVQRRQGRVPEGLLLARRDERRAEKDLVVDPVAHDADRQLGIARLEHQRQQPDQPAAAADLEQADVAVPASVRSEAATNQCSAKGLGSDASAASAVQSAARLSMTS